MKYLYLLLLVFSNNIFTSAQDSGKVTDSNGDPLPFASIYVQGTTNGTTSNVEGNYEFELEKGTYQLVFQFVGFKQKTKTLVIDNQRVKLDVVLDAESFGLNEIVVAADAEDPAYAIIKQAQKKRKYYKDTRYGFARGKEAVTYVQNIRHYYSILQWQDISHRQPVPPLVVSDYLPEIVSRGSFQAL